MALLLVKTTLGTVEGLPAGNNRISVFKGIPYAKPPVGDLRWRAPAPADAWCGIRTAYTYSKIPVQPVRPKGSFYQKLFFPIEIPQSEDCLYLNVWTPAETTEDKLPVAVWIYGGGFTTGYSQKIEFDGEAFAKRGCVFVSFNYRVGLFGFLAHPELSEESGDGVSGNYGLLDQIAALRWVRENISAFGGDPDQITIFGQSAGAMSCMDLSCSPLTEGLFSRAIMESCGGANLEVERQTRTLKQAEALGVNVLTAMGDSSIQEARSESAQRLMQKQLGLKGFQMMEFAPIVDGCVLPVPVFSALKANLQHKIDYMIGSVANEGYGFYAEKPYVPADYVEEAKFLYHDQADAFLRAIHFDPAARRRPADNFGDNMLSACLFWNELELARGGNTAYQYYFTKTLPGEASGAFHSSEHAYIFQTLNRFDLPYCGSDYELSNTMCDYWCNFVKTGDPNGPGLTEWKKYGPGKEKILELGAQVRMIDIPERPGAKFALRYLLEQPEL